MSSPVYSDKITEMAEVQLNGTETDYSHPIFSSAEFMMFYYKVGDGLPTRPETDGRHGAALL